MYSWSLDIQGLILSSVFFGMVVVQIPVGYLSGLYPMKRILGFSMLLSSVLSMLIPPAAQAGAALVIVCRVLQGVAQVLRHDSNGHRARIQSIRVQNAHLFISGDSVNRPT